MNSVFNIVDTTTIDNEQELVDWSTVEIVVYTSEYDEGLMDAYPEFFQAKVKDVKAANSSNSCQALNNDNLNMVLHNMLQLELPGSMVPVFRLQQRSVYGPQYNYGHPYPEDKASYESRVDGTTEQQALIAFLHESTGMKKVAEWQWGKHAECRAVREAKGAHSVDVMIGTYQPTFFRKSNVPPYCDR